MFVFLLTGATSLYGGEIIGILTVDHRGTVPETAATCEDSMAPEDDHPEIELMHEGEAEEAEAFGDVTL